MKVSKIAAMSLSLGGAVFVLQPATAQANIMLFTTTNDFTGWGSTSGTAPFNAASSTAFDYDGVTANGAGTAAGGTGTAGSLAITNTGTNTLGYNTIAYSANLAGDNAFMQAIDPGATTAYQPPSYVAGAMVAYSANILLTYTVPTKASSPGGNYYSIGININQDGSNYNPKFDSSQVSDGTVGGYSTYTETIPYSIVAHSLTNFQFGIFSNSDYVPTSPIYIDAVQVIPAPVPEPASIMTLTGLGSAAALLHRRRRAFSSNPGLM